MHSSLSQINYLSLDDKKDKLHREAKMSVLMTMGAIISMFMIFDFSDIEQVEAWTITNDGVMGGLSQGYWSQEADYAVFDGNVSLENNGGFSSVSVAFRPVDLSAYDGVALRVRGDGQQYAFGFRDTSSQYQHRMTFETTFSEDEEWETIYIPFDKLIANWFGQEIQTAEPLDTSTVWRMNFIISDKQEGSFRLEVASISLHKLISDE